eukprot:c38788_g1_i1 orf=69-230(+)
MSSDDTHLPAQQGLIGTHVGLHAKGGDWAEFYSFSAEYACFLESVLVCGSQFL